MLLRWLTINCVCAKITSYRGDFVLSKNQKNRTVDIVMIALAAAIIAVCSWISIPIGSVPVTMQTFAVAVCGLLIGYKNGTVAVLVYIFLGVIGLPVFSLFRSGVSTILGATGGYMLGFVFISFFGGLFSQKFKDKSHLCFIGLCIGLVLCYVSGTAWYLLVYLGETGKSGLISALSVCVIPYIIPDLIKIALACVVSKAVKLRIGKNEHF